MRYGSGLVGLALAACGSAATLPPPPPGVVFAYPQDGQLDVPVGAPIVVTFSEPIDAGALAPCAVAGGAVTGGLCVVGPDGPVAGTAAVAGDGHTVQLTGATLAPGTAYAVHVSGALVPSAVNVPAGAPLVRFTTRSARPRAAAPALIAINGGPPSAPEALRPLYDSSTIRLVFSEPLDPRTIALAPGALELIDGRTGAAVPAIVLAEGIHVSIDPVADLAPGVAYQLRLGGALADPAGQHVAPATYALTPRRSGGDAPIRELLRTRQPADPGPAVGRTGADRNAIVVAQPLIGRTMSAMQASALTAELGDPLGQGGPIAFTIRRGQRLSAQGLDVRLGGEIPLGLTTGDVHIELASDAGGRIYRSPLRDPAVVPDNARAPLVVDLTMDLAVSAVDATGDAVLAQTVLGVQASGVVIADHGVLDIEALVAMELDVLGVARAPTQLALELISDPAAAVDADRSPPRLVASRPAAGGALPVDEGAQLVFSEPIDLARAAAGGIRLETAAGAPVAAAIESHGGAVVVRPRAALAAGADYRIVLADVADVAGNALAATAPLAFSTPTVVATDAPATATVVYPGVPCALTGATAASPGRCAGGAPTDDLYRPFALPADQPLAIAFSQPIAAASIALGASCNAGSVRIEQVDDAGACVAVVPGSLRVRERGLGFVPDAPWVAGRRYRLTLVSSADKTCVGDDVCGLNAVTPSFDPVAGGLNAAAGGPSVSIGFVGAPASSSTFLITEVAPTTDVNGSGFVDAAEPLADDNRAGVRIAGVSGAVTSAELRAADGVTPVTQGAMYLGGALPVALGAVLHGCALPGGGSAASCVPVVAPPAVLYSTSLNMHATVVQGNTTIQIDTKTGKAVLRLREPAGGPVTGYLFDDRGTPTVAIALALYLDAPDLVIPLIAHDLHSKPIAVTLRGPVRFLPDGRLAIAPVNTADVAIDVNVSATGLTGAIALVIPRGEMKLTLVSPPVRGGLP